MPKQSHQTFWQLYVHEELYIENESYSTISNLFRVNFAIIKRDKNGFTLDLDISNLETPLEAQNSQLSPLTTQQTSRFK